MHAGSDQEKKGKEREREMERGVLSFLFVLIGFIWTDFSTPSIFGEDHRKGVGPFDPTDMQEREGEGLGKD